MTDTPTIAQIADDDFQAAQVQWMQAIRRLSWIEARDLLERGYLPPEWTPQTLAAHRQMMVAGKGAA